ncbi:MAG TPA: hypothetical protein DCL35_02235 [Candidatus Omnitrophica bacterium]|nr:hypothetical protein [Candidatus Omnitrophota bacterium]
MGELKVDYTGGIGFKASAREHSITIDLPKDKGGDDAGMTPPEAFMASLGSCIGVYVARYCNTAKLDPKGMQITLNWHLSDDKTRISTIDVTLKLPNAEPGKRERAILDAAHRCLLHNTILVQPQISVKLI